MYTFLFRLQSYPYLIDEKTRITQLAKQQTRTRTTDFHILLEWPFSQLEIQTSAFIME